MKGPRQPAAENLCVAGRPRRLSSHPGTPRDDGFSYLNEALPRDVIAPQIQNICGTMAFANLSQQCDFDDPLPFNGLAAHRTL